MNGTNKGRNAGRRVAAAAHGVCWREGPAVVVVVVAAAAAAASAVVVVDSSEEILLSGPREPRR